MRIVQLANFYGPRSGGLRTCLDEVGRRYAAAGHDRVLVVPGVRDRVELSAAGRKVAVRSPGVPGGSGYRVMVARRKVLDLLGRLRPDVLEVSDKIVLGWLGPWSAARGIPTLLISHERLDGVLAARMPGLLGHREAADALNRRFCRLVSRVVVASRYAQAEFDRLPWVDVRRIPLGVDLDVFRPARLQRPGAGLSVQLVLVSRLSKEKRPELAIDALRVLRASGVRAGLLVVGDGPMRRSLERRAAGLPARFLGHLPGAATVAHVVSGADVAVAPGPVETFGLAVLEAMACGTPVVVPSSGAARELVGDVGSGVVTDGTALGLAEGVAALLDLPERERRASARARAESFPWSVTVAGLLAAHGAEAPSRETTLVG